MSENMPYENYAIEEYELPKTARKYFFWNDDGSCIVSKMNYYIFEYSFWNGLFVDEFGNFWQHKREL